MKYNVSAREKQIRASQNFSSFTDTLRTLEWFELKNTYHKKNYTIN